MTATTNFVAVDLGASGGRVLLGRWDGSQFQLELLHRFPNGPVNVHGSLYWDVLRLWTEIKAGLQQYTARHSQPLSGIGVDTWGVDYALLDRAGRLLGNPYHYRDSRTNGMMERAFATVPRRQIFEHTGIQFIQLNTLFQLLSMVEANDPQLEAAETMLLMPDLFHYWLTGEATTEFTIASTTQMLDARRREWDREMLAMFKIPARILPAIAPPGTVLGNVRQEVAEEVGLRAPAPVVAPASHDTGSAVAAIPELDENGVYISSGTWSLMGVEIPEPIINDTVLSLNFTNEGGVNNTVRFLKNIAGLWLLQESRRHWQREGRDYSWEELMAAGEQAEPFRSLIDPDAPDFLGPGNMPEFIRAYCRRTGQAEPESVGAIVRCCLESLALKYRWVLGALETLTGRQLGPIRVVGGGSQNRLLCQFTADACQRPVIAGPVEATALGNIMVQAIAGGYLDDVAAGRQAIAATVHRQTYSPGPGEPWSEAFERFEKLLSTQ